MGHRNYLVEGVSTSGKTSVCHELRRRGHHAVNGDTDLAYVGDPLTGEPWTGEPTHWTHLWDVSAVRRLVADPAHPVTFLCGGSRNVAGFVDLLDGVFVLTVDEETLRRRLDERPADEFGADPEERALVERLHRTGEGVPDGIRIDATAPLAEVVDAILAHVPRDGRT
ncbi:AAA family ATPase [Phycicoccus sonneratiae]|uniref:AAA family ATPase n=1 Tax=Phycicoccus sonneratiae TaxID=2807628 RepID=A0ABS2CLV4_9MICO|nr:AAA family ATPase [Phycicoccus sonneraticus]MBM6400770.1 AAA family ATPase [Phycicoccus sonneraticus]